MWFTEIAKKKHIILLAGVLLLLFLIREKRDHSPVFLWENIYFIIPINASISEETVNSYPIYKDAKGELLGEITDESHFPLPLSHGQSYRISVGTKIYCVDHSKATKDYMNKCGLLVETKSGGVFFAYPYSPYLRDENIAQKVYDTFYPDYKVP